MPERLPSDLARLLAADSSAARDGAWHEFVQQHSRLILSVARSLGGSYDAIMDRYAFILEQLRRDDCRRLRAYTPDSRARFTTWLVVVCRRLCMDEHRSKFGRARAGSDVIRLQTRRSLVESLFSTRELEAVAASDPQPDAEWETRSLQDAMQAHLARLDARDRLMIKLRFEDDLSAAAIARVMHIPTPFHVYRRLKQVLTSLRTVLEAGAAQSQPARPLDIAE
jgi:RNA polymerase sigma factor (sigma-70 family)